MSLLLSLSSWAVVAIVIVVIEGGGSWCHQHWVVDAVRGCLPLMMLGVVATAIIIAGDGGG